MGAELLPFAACLSGGLLAGYAGGTLAALAGVGGGLIYTPLLTLLLPLLADAQHPWSVGIAVSASMIAIILTGGNASLAHWHQGHVNVAHARAMLPWLIAGAALGLWNSFHLMAWQILLLLMLLDGWIAADLWRARTPTLPFSPVMASPLVGYVSGLLGIGGGTMLMPLLRRLLPLSAAVATSGFCGFVMVSMACGLNALLHDQWWQHMQTWLPWLLCIWLGIAVGARQGAVFAVQLHSHWSEQQLRRKLAVVFALLASALGLAAVMGQT